MKISIRMDDITPDMDWSNFLRFKKLCDLYQVKPLIGVVPDNQDPNLHIGENHHDFWEYLLQLKKEGWQIAQHGCIHQYTTKKMGCFPLNQLSEFAGISYQKQYEALKRGDRILKSHGIMTDLFMAPAHSYDKNTLRALKKLGFTKMTDGFGSKPYIQWGMIFYPISYKQSSSLRKSSGYTTFVVHTNTMNDKDFERYEMLFQKYRDRLISYTDYLRVPPKKRGAAGRIAEYFMAFSKFMLVSVTSHKA